MTPKEKASEAFTDIVNDLPDDVYRRLIQEIDIVSDYINKGDNKNG